MFELISLEKQNLVMKHSYLATLFLLLVLPALSYAQCDTTAIDQSTYQIFYADAVGGNNVPQNAIDGNDGTFWNTGGSVAFPHELIIDLGEEKVLNGLSIKPRINSNLGKLSEYQIFLYSDPANPSDTPEAGGSILYNGPWQETPQFIYFGNTVARYVRIDAQSNYDPSNNKRLMISEVVIYEDTTCPDDGLVNQIISFDAVAKQTTESPDLELFASSNMGTDVSFEIVEGGNIVSLTGSTISFGQDAGKVVLRAFNEGDATHYPAEQLISFDVIDLNSFYPTVNTRLVEEVPVIKSADGIYPVYLKAWIAEPEFLHIEDITATVDGQPLEVKYADGAYVALWEPGQAGTYEFEFTSIGSNGNSSEPLIKTIEVEESATTMTVDVLDKVLVNFPNPGRTIVVDTILPQFLGTYKKATAYLDVTCPNIAGGCDDWDRKASVEIQAPNGQWIEIIRYMTPYGVACSHVTDLTDFMDLLQGEVKFRVFVDTWGTGGWDFSLRLELEEGEPDYLYRTITKVWDKAGAPFGNLANLQPMETVEVVIPEHTLDAKMRLTTTGHAWGATINTGNAAEFYYATHNIAVNGNNTFQQYLFNDCNPNPDNCLGQQGNWPPNRAGWCPGAIAPPFEFDMSDFVGEDSYTLDYIFQTTYVDYCHPNNPNCVSPTPTCEDCSNTFNPIYMIDGFIINYSNTFTTNPSSVSEQVLEEDAFLISPNPVDDMLNIKTRSISGYARFLLIDVAGRIIKSKEVDVMATVSGEVDFYVGDLEAGTYFVRAFTDKGSRTYKIIKI